MKKLKLQAIELGAREFLSRDQLKNVFGGDDGSGGSGNIGGGSGDGNCITMGCQFYDAQYHSWFFGECHAINSGEACGCVSGDHVSDPTLYTDCNLN